MTDTHGVYKPVIRVCTLSDKVSDLFPTEEGGVVAPKATSYTVTREWLEDLRRFLVDTEEEDDLSVEHRKYLASVVNYISDIIGPVVREPKTALQVVAEGLVRDDYREPTGDDRVEFLAEMEGYQSQARTVLAALAEAGYTITKEK